jgi:hypothetical protein
VYFQSVLITYLHIGILDKFAHTVLSYKLMYVRVQFCTHCTAIDRYCGSIKTSILNIFVKAQLLI